MGLQDMLAHIRSASMLEVENTVNEAIRKHGRTLVAKVIQGIEPNGKGSLSTALNRSKAKAA